MFFKLFFILLHILMHFLLKLILEAYILCMETTTMTSTNEITNTEAKYPKGYWSGMFSEPNVYKWASEKWSTINQRTVNGLYAQGNAVSTNAQQLSYLKRNIRIEMTKEELFRFCSENESTIKNMINNGERPSIDRIDNEGHYSIDNIQIISLYENQTKKSTRTPRKKISKLHSMLINRNAYIENHPNCTRLVVDIYLESFPIKFILAVFSNDSFENAFQVYDENFTDHKSILKSLEYLKDLQDAYEEEQQIKLNEKIESKLKKDGRKALIEQEKQQLIEFRENKKKMVNHPRYEEVSLICKNSNRPNVIFGVDIEGLTPTKAIIKILASFDKGEG